MILEILLWIFFIIAVAYNTYHWCGYFYTRFSRHLEQERKAVRFISRVLAEQNEVHISKKKRHNDEDNIGYQ